MTPRRREDWPSLMQGFVDGARGRPFAWGSWDCCLAALAHVDAITVSDNKHYEQFAGRWHDLRSAVQAIEALGGYERAVTDVFGDPLTHPAKAQRGDLVLFDSGHGPALGFIGLSGTRIMAMAQGAAGFSPIDRTLLLRAWRI